MDLARRGVLETIRRRDDRSAARTSLPRPKNGTISDRPMANDWPRMLPGSYRHESGTGTRSDCRGRDSPASSRPSFTLGGSGSAIAYNREAFDTLVRHGLDQSPIHEVLIEESIIGWKEFEMEVMRDLDDNVVIICSIENFDPMGVHTGDSITVAPAQTLSDKEYQRMRDASLAIIREIGVETGGSNIQFAVHPGQRSHDRDRDEPVASAVPAPWPPRPPGFRLPRSRQSWPSATDSTNSPMTLRGRPRPVLSQPSITR